MRDAEMVDGSIVQWMPRMVVCLIAGAMMAAGGGTSVAWAQTPGPSPSVEPGAKVRAAIEFVERERPEEALPLLVDVVETSPAFVSERHGAASYWLGRAYRAAGDSAKAHAAWRAGVNVLNAASTLDVRLADAYVRSVFQRQKTREQQGASEVYLKLIAVAGSRLHARENAIVYQHVAQALPVLPEQKRTRVTPDPTTFRQGQGRVTDDAGSWLAAWWRRQDARPATVKNERLIEHLRRVVVAEQRYATTARRAGFDARGRIYVRLGKPSVVEHLHNEPLRYDKDSRPTENEFWVYEELGPYAQFLFVRRGDRFVIGSFRDLLPSRIRGPVYTQDPHAIVNFWTEEEDAGGKDFAEMEAGVRASPSSGKSVEAGLAMKALYDYYRQVAPYQPRYLNLQSKIWRQIARMSPAGGTGQGVHC